jgi:YidC/Oxa1 family membrane protein insertase
MGEIWFTFVGFFEQVLMLLATATGSMAVAVIIFTILARLVILPLTLKSIRSSRKMQELQPKIKELQRKYGKDQRKLQEETVQLYKDYQINPLGGCLPLLLQLPIFLGVYQGIIHLMRPDQRQYLGEAMAAAVNDRNIQPLLDLPIMGGLWQAVGLSEANTLIDLLDQTFFGMNLGQAAFAGDFSSFNGIPYVVLPILSVVLQLTQQLMAMPRVQDPQQKMMSQMMLFMPLFFAYIALTFPLGAVLYWLTSSIVGIIQQYFISGWGSLANYLKFLPADTRAQPAPSLVAAGAGAGGGTATLDEGSMGAAEEPPQRRSFWDVVRPLVDIEEAGSGAGSGATLESRDTSSTEEQPTRQTEQQTMEQARKQATPSSKGGGGSRRQRRRRR